MNATPNEEQNATSAESETKAEAKPPEAAPAPQRSTLEKVIVRLLIFVLVVFAAVEARARFGYTQTLNGVKQAFDEDENKEETSLSDIRSALKFFPSVNREEDEDGYHFVKLRWFSFVYGDKYEITLKVDSDEDDPLVLSFMTPDADEPDATVAKKGAAKKNGDGGENGPTDPGVTMSAPPPSGGSGGRGGRGGRGRFNPQAMFTENDKNKDGKLSKDEWPEGSADRLGRMDANKDGTLTKEEVDKAIADFRKRRGSGGGRGGSGRSRGGEKKKRQRPPSEGDDAKKPAETKKATPAETDKKKPAETDKKKPAETDKKKPAETDKKKPAETDKKKPAETDKKKPANAEKKDKPKAAAGSTKKKKD